jgi:hypothetical protein
MKGHLREPPGIKGIVHATAVGNGVDLLAGKYPPIILPMDGGYTGGYG